MSTITLHREHKEDDKLTPQAKVIVETIKAKVGLNKPIERADLIKELEASGSLNTRQDVARVISFYAPRMIESGLISTTKAERAAKEPKEPKAKAEPKAAKAKAEPKAAEPKAAGKDSKKKDGAAA